MTFIRHMTGPIVRLSADMRKCSGYAFVTVTSAAENGRR
jgi:hypothetical protein